MSEYQERLDGLRDLTAQLAEANRVAGDVYFARRRAMRSALQAGCHPEAIARACQCSISAVRVVEGLPQGPLPRLGHAEPSDLVTASASELNDARAPGVDPGETERILRNATPHKPTRPYRRRRPESRNT